MAAVSVGVFGSKFASTRPRSGTLRRRITPASTAVANERLAHFGLFAGFEAAVKSRDISAVEAVLIRAQFTREQAHYTATMLLRAPEKYGY